MAIEITNFRLFDAFLNILGIIGTWPAIQRLYFSRSPTPLEIKLKWILISYTAMMFVRIPYVGFNIKELDTFVYLFAIAAACSVVLYIETLMRKHLPLWFKIYLTSGSIYFIFLTVSKSLTSERDNLLYFAAFVASMAIFVLWLVFFRNRKEHSKVENALIDQFGITIILLTPLLLTDIFSYGTLHLPRFGICGILIMTYFSLCNQALFSKRSEMFRKLVKSFLFSILLTLAFGLLLHGENFSQWTIGIEGRSFVLFFLVNLIFRIHFAVKNLDGEEEVLNFLKIVNESNKKSVSGFLKDINVFFDKMDRTLLANAELQNYDVEGFIQVMEPVHASVLSIFELKAMLEENAERKMLSDRNVQAIEQIIHLLEKNEMTYISQIGKKSPSFLLFNVPMAAYREMIDIKSKIVYDLSLLIEKQSEVKNE